MNKVDPISLIGEENWLVFAFIVQFLHIPGGLWFYGILFVFLQ